MNKALFTSNRDDWETPKELFKSLNKEFNFTLDPCSNDYNYKCVKHYTEKENGLEKLGKMRLFFCNPPYGREISKWVKKCYLENLLNNTLIVLLIPARTDTLYFHEYIYNKPYVDIIFIKGRLKFEINGVAQNSAPFPSMLVIFNKKG